MPRPIDPFRFPLTACLEEWRNSKMDPFRGVQALHAAHRIDNYRVNYKLIPSCTFPTIRRSLPL